MLLSILNQLQKIEQLISDYKKQLLTFDISIVTRE